MSRVNSSIKTNITTNMNTKATNMNMKATYMIKMIIINMAMIKGNIINNLYFEQQGFTISNCLTL